MRRIIEEAIEKRKKKQQEIERILNEIGEVLGKPFFLRKRGHIQHLLLEFKKSLFELITLQDKEWDALSNNHYTSIFNSIGSRVDDLDAKFSNFKTITGNFINLEKKLKDLIENVPEINSDSQSKELGNIKDEISTVQYSDFEKRFRGDKKYIYERLKRYVKYFIGKNGILDIGCGRGEFVRLLKENGIDSEGLDISDSMLKEAASDGLNCRKEDALTYLKKRDDNSLEGIFSSQVIEHFSPEYLKDVVAEGFRVLSPGGIMIFETVNPLSVFALTNIYYLDITHQKPLHPEFMRYLFKAYGLSEVEILYSDPLSDHYLEEIPAEYEIARQFNSNVDKINKILFSSPDYAVFGKKT